MDILAAQVTGLGQLQIQLDRGIDALNVEDLLDDLQAVLLNRIKTRFLNTEDPDGNKWPESQAALARQATGRARAGAGTLFDTGKLFQEIQAFNNGPGERAIGTDVFYGRIHQLGLNGQEARVFLGFSADDIRVVEQIATARVDRALNV